MRRTLSPGSTPLTFEMSTEKLSSGSTVVSPLTETLKVYVDSPAGIVAPVAEAAV